MKTTLDFPESLVLEYYIYETYYRNNQEWYNVKSFLNLDTALEYAKIHIGDKFVYKNHEHSNGDIWFTNEAGTNLPYIISKHKFYLVK